MKQDDYKKYIEKQKVSPKLYEQLEQIQNHKKIEKFKPALIFACIICVVISGMFAFSALDNNDNQTNANQHHNKEKAQAFRKDKNGVYLLKKDVLQQNIEFSDITPYETLPSFHDKYWNTENLVLTDLDSQETIEAEYLPSIESTFDLNKDTRNLTTRGEEKHRTTYEYAYANGMTICFEPHGYISVNINDISNFNISDNEEVVQYITNSLKKFNGQTYETYDFSSYIDNYDDDDSYEKKYVCPTDINEAEKTLYKLEYKLEYKLKEDDGKKRLSFELPNQNRFSFVNNVQVISPKKALTNILDDSIASGGSLFSDSDSFDYEALIKQLQSMDEKELAKKVVGVQLNYDWHTRSSDDMRVYPYYNIMISYDQYPQEELEKGENAIVVFQTLATDDNLVFAHND
ncbi:hypothetical protein EDD63_1328 [Breznakia blatticola]|uniref:Uncharacterized protein n=1 Tax=Breznakia blatticola TaxID=1754012 RepID=A0A4R7ZC46_9FIRM|nr:hypothetical protein [Breznakia blatticola]TDW14752.1 hypothetical protein EDD63_1328 [Breznakia blatticola]